MFNVKDTLEKLFNVTIKNRAQILYKGKVISNVLTQKIVRAINENIPYRGWVCFLDKLMQNPDEHCRKQLFDYVERYGLPICEDGFIYAWKAVNADFYDKHTGKTHCYRVGSIIKKDRKDCNDDPTQGCSTGLHCGEYSYVRDFGANEDSRFVLVRFSPKDVIACPTDCNWRKLRVCKLRVMREAKREEIFPLEDSYMGKGKLPKRNKLGQFC